MKGRSRNEYCVRSSPHSGHDEGRVFRLNSLCSQCSKQIMEASLTRFSPPAAAPAPSVPDFPVDADEAGETPVLGGDSISLSCTYVQCSGFSKFGGNSPQKVIDAVLGNVLTRFMAQQGTKKLFFVSVAIHTTHFFKTFPFARSARCRRQSAP